MSLSYKFLTLYFDWAFLFFVSPFHMVQKTNGLHTISKNLKQSAVCLLLTILFLFQNISAYRVTFALHLDKGFASPLDIFYVLTVILGFLTQLLCIKVVWRNQDQFLAVVNFLHARNCYFLNTNTNSKTKIVVNSVFILFAIFALCEPVLKLLPQSFLSLNESFWSFKTISMARFSFFIVNFTQSQETIEPENVKPIDYFLAVLSCLGWSQRCFLVVCNATLPLVFVITVWTACECFSSQIRKQIITQKLSKRKTTRFLILYRGKCRLQWREIYNVYKNIRELCQRVNCCIGTFLTSFIASCILTQAACMDSMTDSQDITIHLRIAFLLSVITLVYVLAADACDKLDTLKLWISNEDNRKHIPSGELDVVLAELVNQEVGIRGSDIFTITYSVLWKIASTVITIFLICSQVRQEERQVLQSFEPPLNSSHIAPE